MYMSIQSLPSLQNSSNYEKIIQSLKQLNSIIVGKEEQIRLIMTAFLIGGHILLDDIPGMGKTTLAKALSTLSHFHFKRVQFTSDLMPSDILGFHMYNHVNSDKAEDFILKKGPIFSQIFLADEINRSSPRTQSALLESMSERQVTLDGMTYPLDELFWLIATQNPSDNISTFSLPSSQLDRFMFQITMGYPDEINELRILKKEIKPLSDVHQIFTLQDIKDIRHEITQQNIEDNLYKYIIRLLNTTRHHKDIETGLSPRVGLSLIDAAKSFAYLQGRRYVNLYDIQQIFTDAVIHRLQIKQITNTEDKRSFIENLLIQTSL